jgi:hypothetical protein
MKAYLSSGASMSLPRWDDEMKFDLLRLKSELRPENFRALHQPLGLGTVRSDPLKAPTMPFPHLTPMKADAKDAEKRPYMPGLPQSMPTTLVDAIGPLPPLGKGPRTRLQSALRFAMVHALDLAFVCLCLSLGLILLSWVVDPLHVSLDLNTLKQASPLQFLQKLQTLAVIVGIYTAFVLYWIFFKVVSGTTLGETCVDLMKQEQMPGRSAPLNGSGDS